MNAVMKLKRNDSNCVGILSDQGEAATASNLSESATARTDLRHNPQTKEHPRQKPEL